ncbi:MAG: lipoyl synthase, partial [Candidatus Zixiibacteriota bacterium]
MRRRQKPNWLKTKLPSGGKLESVRGLLADNCLHTVCQSAACPNLGDCFSQGTATFLVMGNVCTRNCRFCNIENGRPQPLDSNEPETVAEAVKTLGLKHTVITSVTRDDLPDGGATHFAETVRAIGELCPETTVEVLIPDFLGKTDSLHAVLESKPDVLNHNVETVARLYPTVRPEADYHRSLHLLRNVKGCSPETVAKSGFMVGLGESEEEVLEVLKDLREVGCEIVTIGQYLQPSKEHLSVREYIHPDRFEDYKREALQMGFSYVASAPLVRSS